MSEEFRLDVVVRDGGQWVVVHGEIDVATAPLLDETFDQRVSPDSDVVVDLGPCEFIDSTGVRSLVGVGRRWFDHDRSFSIVSPPASAARFTLDLLGVGDTIPVHDDVDAVGADDERADSA